MPSANANVRNQQTHDCIFYQEQKVHIRWFCQPSINCEAPNDALKLNRFTYKFSHNFYIKYNRFELYLYVLQLHFCVIFIQ